MEYGNVIRNDLQYMVATHDVFCKFVNSKGFDPDTNKDAIENPDLQLKRVSKNKWVNFADEMADNFQMNIRRRFSVQF